MRCSLALWALLGITLCGCGEPGDHQVAPLEVIGMDEPKFWTLIEEVHQETGYDGPKKAKLLQARLVTLAPEDLRVFARLWDKQQKRAYDWGLWAAAYVIHGGCSDDGFGDFRSNVILLGRRAFVDALETPDSLLGAAIKSGGNLRFDDLSFVVSSAWETVMGDEEQPGWEWFAGATPTGHDWNEDELPKIVPKLWEQYGWAQGG